MYSLELMETSLYSYKSFPALYDPGSVSFFAVLSSCSLLLSIYSTYCTYQYLRLSYLYPSMYLGAGVSDRTLARFRTEHANILDSPDNTDRRGYTVLASRRYSLYLLMSQLQAQVAPNKTQTSTNYVGLVAARLTRLRLAAGPGDIHLACHT